MNQSRAIDAMDKAMMGRKIDGPERFKTLEHGLRAALDALGMEEREILVDEVVEGHHVLVSDWIPDAQETSPDPPTAA